MEACPACGKELPGEFPFCPFCGAPLVVPTAGGAKERKVVSILFCDLVGFTGASESADPEEVQARLVPYHDRVRGRIEAFGGTTEKFIGDAVMAVFGAPVAHEDDAERAVRAGLAILETIEELNGADPALALSVRVGVNTGEVVVALGARPEQGEGMVSGDVVNTAARIQAAAPVDGVAVGEGTFRATERVFDYEPLEPISAKGKSAPVSVWQALAPRARFGSDVIRSVTTPLVGREVDLALLTRTFDKAAQERSVQLVTVSGEPGVGKSRLIAELGAYIDDLDLLVTWRQGRCLPYGEGITFWALGEIVKAHAGIYESDPPETAAGKLDLVLPDSDDRPWLAARLLPLVGLDAGEQVTHEELFTAWRRFLESIAEQNPLVLVVEDIHWADAALLAFLEHLADWAQGVALLVVCTTRPELYERHPTWAAGLRSATTISLSPLSDTDTARLVSALLEQAVLPAETQQLLLERAGGNPFYAEEFVRMLRDRGLLDEHGTLRADADLSFPDSIQALIAARLDTLPQDRKHLLQDAAVMGKVFWAGSVAAMGGRDPREVELALHELARKELVRPARQSSMEGEAEYGFWHLLVRDVAYAQIPRAERATRHMSAASWLEEKAGDRVEDLAEVLAYHTGEASALAEAIGDRVLQAEISPAAARYNLLAGERTLGLDTVKALAHLDVARRLTGEDEPAYPLTLLRWAAAARQSGRLRETAEAAEQAAAAFEEHGNVLLASEALVLLADTRRQLGEPGHLAIIERAIAMLEPTPGPELVAALASLAGLLAAVELGETIAPAERALALARELGLPLPARALGYRGLARSEQGDAGGLADAEQALELLIAEGRGRDAAVLQLNLGVCRAVLEGPPAAQSQYEAARAFADARGLTESALTAAANGVNSLVGAGRLEEALESAEQLLPQLAKSGLRAFELVVRCNQAVALIERGDDAKHSAEQAVNGARDFGDPFFLAAAGSAFALTLIAAGDTGAARELLDEIAAEERRDADDMPRLVRAARALGDAELAKRLAAGVAEHVPLQHHSIAAARACIAELEGDVGAAALYADAADRWEQFGATLEQAHALLGQGRCLALAGDPHADAPLRRARALFHEMGARPRVTECDALIAKTSKLTS